MKKISTIILAIILSTSLLNAQSKNDSTPCKTYIQFVNKTDLNVEIKIYSKVDMYLENLIRTLNVPAGKSKKMKAEDGETYYYNAASKSDGNQKFLGSLYWTGSVDAEECKTIDEEIILKNTDKKQ